MLHKICENLLKKNKKSQYFVVAAIVFISLALVLVSSNIMGGSRRPIFEELKSNFQNEAYIAINSAIASSFESEYNVFEQFDNFVERYILYSAEKGVRFDLVYLLMYEDRIFIKNYLDSDFMISTQFGEYNLSYMDVLNVSAENYIELRNPTNNYLFVFDDLPVQFRSVSELKIIN